MSAKPTPSSATDPMGDLVVKWELLGYHFEPDGVLKNPHGFYYKRSRSYLNIAKVGPGRSQIYPPSIRGILSTEYLDAIVFSLAMLKSKEESKYETELRQLEYELDVLAEDFELVRAYRTFAHLGVMPLTRYRYRKV